MRWRERFWPCFITQISSSFWHPRKYWKGLLSTLTVDQTQSDGSSDFSFKANGLLNFVMEYADRVDLYELINERAETGAPFSEEMILDKFVQVCLGVKAIHDRKILHRDIKVRSSRATGADTDRLGNTAELTGLCCPAPRQVPKCLFDEHRCGQAG